MMMPSRLGVIGAALVDLERQLLQPRDQIGADDARRPRASLMLMSWPLSAFVAGVKIGSGSRSDSRRPGGQRHAAHAAGLLVFLPARAREVAAGHALDRHRPCPAAEHRSAAQHVRRAARARQGSSPGSVAIT